MRIQPVQSEYNAFTAGTYLELHNAKVLEKQLGYGNKHYYGCYGRYGNQCQQISTQWSHWRNNCRVWCIFRHRRQRSSTKKQLHSRI